MCSDKPTYVVLRAGLLRRALRRVDLEAVPGAARLSSVARTLHVAVRVAVLLRSVCVRFVAEALGA
jgi:hypothetical protein